MPGKFLPHLRLLQPYSSLFPTMKLADPSLQSSRSIPLFCRTFPFKLKYRALLTPEPATQLGLRSLSSHPFRRRTQTTRRVETSTRASSSPKSLIEDEAELSDWVGELRTDSFRGRLTSDEENDDDTRSRGSGVRKMTGGNKENNRIRERNSYSLSTKRNRESDSHGDDFGGRVRRSSGFGMDSRHSAMSRGRFHGEMDRGEGNYSTRKFKKGKTSSSGRREAKEFNSGGGRGSRGNARMLSINAATSRYEEDQDGDEEEEEKMKSIGSLSDLISEESSEDAEDESDEGDIFLKKSDNALFGSERRGVPQKAESVSGGKSDSYLSDTRSTFCILCHAF